MGSSVYNGRYTVELDEEKFVVFIIGFRINRLLSFSKWVPVFKAMGPMIKELYQHPELGFLHVEFLFGWRKITLIQYWKGFDQLVNYAHGNTHLSAWKAFNKKAHNNSSVGIFHETYEVNKGSFETIYHNMPKIGLAKAFSHVPVSGQTTSAKKRMDS